MSKKKPAKVKKSTATALSGLARKAAALVASAAGATMQAARVIGEAFERWEADGSPGKGFHAVLSDAASEADRNVLDKGRVSQLLSAWRMDRIVPVASEGEARRLAKALRDSEIDAGKADPSDIRRRIEAAGGIAGFIESVPAKVSTRAKSATAAEPVPAVVASDDPIATLHDAIEAVMPRLDRDAREAACEMLAATLAKWKATATAMATVPTVGKAKRKVSA